MKLRHLQTVFLRKFQNRRIFFLCCILRVLLLETESLVWPLDEVVETSKKALLDKVKEGEQMRGHVSVW